MKLSDLAGAPESRRPRKRVGRGAGSGRGKTCGRGMKGQNSRSGTALGGFEGGQMPLYQRLPKRGFNPLRRKKIGIVNLGALQKFVESGKIDPNALVDVSKLRACGIAGRSRDGVRLLASGELTTPLSIEVTSASAAAISAVTAIGGSVTIAAPAADRTPDKVPEMAESEDQSEAETDPQEQSTNAETA